MSKSGDRVFGMPMVRWPLVRLAVYATAALMTIVLGTIATRLLVPPEPSPWHDLGLLKNLILPLVLFGVYAGLVRLIERRRASELDFRKGYPDLFLGAIVGSTIIGLAVLVLWNLGMVEISSRTGIAGIGRELSVLMIITMIEELLFRVMLFAIAEEIVGSLCAIVVSAAAYGLAHFANPGATPFAVLALSMELGLMLALAYMLTRNVWFAVGIHAGWNFTQSFVFGALNSGQQHPHSYFQTSFSGPDYLTGGLFGLEGSLVTLGLSVVVAAVLFALILQKRRWISLRFRFGGSRREFANA